LIDSGVSKAEDIAAATRGLFGKISQWRGREEVASEDARY
jgi:hypothetical protein